VRRDAGRRQDRPQAGGDEQRAYDGDTDRAAGGKDSHGVPHREAWTGASVAVRLSRAPGPPVATTGRRSVPDGRDTRSRDAAGPVRHDERVTVVSTVPEQLVAPARLGAPWLAVARIGAAVLGLLTVAGLAAGTVLHLANRGSPTTVGVTDWWLFPLVSGVSFAGTGAWLVWVRPRLSIGWLALAIGTTNAVMTACLEYGVWALDRPGGAPLGGFALWLGNWIWVTSLLLIATVLPLILPDGRLFSRRWRLALALSVTVVVANSVDWATIPYEAWSPALAAAGAVNPLGVDRVWDAVFQVPDPVPLSVATVVAVLVAFGSLVVRWRHSTGVPRQQLKWILFGAVPTLVLWAVGLVYGPVFTALAMLPLPLGCLVGVLRWRLWDIDVVLSRSLRYATLTATVVAVYVACVGLLGGLLGRTTGAPLVATALVAVCVEPLHRRLRALVNRLVYGEPDDPFAVLARAGQRLEGARDATSIAEQVLPEVVASVAAALRLPYVAVTLADGATVEDGTRAEPLAHTPLAYGGQRVGQRCRSRPPATSPRPTRPPRTSCWTGPPHD
jgi:hypothetical protein